MLNVRLEAPWNTYQKKVDALFRQDPDIEVGELYPEEDGSFGLDIEVMNHEKFLALDRMMPAQVKFGNVKLMIHLYDEENEELSETSPLDLLKIIFEGNPIVKDTKVATDPSGVPHMFVRFVPEVVQFFDDDISDYNGNWNGLAEDIAREVFDGKANEVNFCTADLRENENGEGVVVPLGEWP